jgi:hypothetical protein
LDFSAVASCESEQIFSGDWLGFRSDSVRGEGKPPQTT